MSIEDEPVRLLLNYLEYVKPAAERPLDSWPISISAGRQRLVHGGRPVEKMPG